VECEQWEQKNPGERDLDVVAVVVVMVAATEGSKAVQKRKDRQWASPFRKEI
jgi:hypothetical protein